MTYKAIIIGAGPAGFDCALKLAKNGQKVALIEKDTVGGTCTNRGCIPTKALISSAHLVDDCQKATRKGITIENLTIDFTKIMARKNRIVQTIVRGIDQQIKTNNIELIQGEGHILSPNQVQVNDQTLNAENIVIATGSAPIQLFDHPDASTSDEILELTEIPQELVIIGGGVIGLEFAHIFQTLGSKVTIIEAQDRLLPLMDTSISTEMASICKRKGITLHLGQSAKFGNSKLTIENTDIPYSKILVAVGRKATFPTEELQKIGVNTEKNHIPTNPQLQTNIKNIYALGDITDIFQLAHVASYQGKIAAKSILGEKVAANYDTIPNCVYTVPEAASVGKRESDCHPDEIIIQNAPLAANAKARCDESLYGFLKIIVDKKTETILGAHMIAPHATDIMTAATFMVGKKMTLSDIQNTIFAHPTLSELFIGIH